MARKKMDWWDYIPIVLLTVGGINWGLVGLFDVNLVTILSMGYSAISTTIYTLVGLSGVYSLYWLVKDFF